MKPSLPDRDHPARGVQINDDVQCLVFLTIATHKRRPWLANAEVHKLLRVTWFECTAWHVGTYLLMPDHLHLFCVPRRTSCTIETWIRFWKRSFAAKHSQPNWQFQAAGWHHRLRNDESREEQWHYVTENPVRAGLVTSSKQWPHQGKIFAI